MMCLLLFGSVHAQLYFASADTMSAGVVKTGNVGQWAQYIPNHYYKTVLNGYGMIRVITHATNTSTTYGAGINIHMYFKDSVEEYANHQVNMNINSSVTDTFWITGAKADSVYFRVRGDATYGGPFTYTIRYDLFNVYPNTEAEPNDDFAHAQLLNPGDSVKGHISYKGAPYYVDYNDYYKLVLPEDGTASLLWNFTNLSMLPGWNIPAPTIYARGKNNSYVNMAHTSSSYSNNLVIANNANTPLASPVYDTMRMYGRAGDTLYIYMYNYFSGWGIGFAGAYNLKLTMSDQSAVNETAGNDDMAQAQFITTTDTVKGHIGYYDGNSNIDQNDYFKIAKPTGGNVKLYITATNKFGYDPTSVNPQVYAYDKYGNQLLVYSANGASGGGLLIGNVWQQPYNTSITDTMSVKCISTDSMYIRIYNYNAAFTYKFHYEYVSGPDAQMAYSRTGNEFGFTNLSKDANNYKWLMSNGNQYTSFYPPMTTYVPGFYNVKLIAGDNVCNVFDTAAVSFTVAGVEYYTPKSAGAGGDAAIDIYGGALDTSTHIKLVQGSTIIYPREKYINSKLNHLTAIMDLHFANAGLYDVVIEVPGQSPITYANGFRIDTFRYPTAWSQVVAPARWRTNVDNRFTLVVGNSGNVTASGVVVAMVWPQTTNVTWIPAEHKPDYNKMDTLIDGTHTYVFPNSIYKFIYDSTNTATTIDSFEGQPFNGYIRYLQIPHIPAYGTVEIPFIARAATPTGQIFRTFTHRPNIFGSCPNGNYENLDNDLAAELIDATDAIADKTKVPLFTAFTKSVKIGQKHMASAASYAGKEFWAWWDGYEADHEQYLYDWIKETDANNQYAIKTAAQELVTAGINSGVASQTQSLNGRISKINNFLARNPNLDAKDFEKTIDYLNGLGSTLSRTEKLKYLFDMTKDMGDKSAKLNQLLDIIDNCPELDKQKNVLKDMNGDELTHFGGQQTNTNSVTSFDPNGIYGPSGADVPQYINNLQRQPFLITFENMDTATADAQDVTIVDTIDKTKFNISSFTFGNVVIGNQLIRVPNGRSQFTVQTRLAGTPGMYVRINANLDTATGVITWHLGSVDSATSNRPVLNGFLPPNISKPEGEGSVSYTVEPLNTVTDGTILHSIAYITFDDNAVISTNTWSNTVDVNPPASHIATATLQGDRTINLHMTGTDAASGIRSYRVYYSTNNGAWQYLGSTNTDSMTITGQYDSSYAFYCVAVDKVENKEVKTPQAEVSITVPAGVHHTTVQSNTVKVYPNPAGSQVSIELHTTSEEAITIQLFSITGQQVATLYKGSVSGNYIVSSNLQHINAGVYTIQLTTAGGERQTAKLVIVK